GLVTGSCEDGHPCIPDNLQNPLLLDPQIRRLGVPVGLIIPEDLLPEHRFIPRIDDHSQVIWLALRYQVQEHLDAHKGGLRRVPGATAQLPKRRIICPEDLRVPIDDVERLTHGLMRSCSTCVLPGNDKYMRHS